MPPSVSSPTMMTTPRPLSSNLRPFDENGDEAVPAGSSEGASAVIGEEEEKGGQRQGGEEGSVAPAIADGRITPTWEATTLGASSAGASTSTSSAPSSAAVPTDPPSPNPTTISSFSATTFSSQPPAPASPHASGTALTFNATISHPAEVGMGTLHGEEQLKSALSSKDRMFVLVLANELEAFITRISAGQVAVGGVGDAGAGTGASTSVVAALGPSTPLGATPTSKFQRMLVYKAAEWYGLKAVPGPEGSMIIGVLGTFYEQSNSLRLSDLVPAAPSPAQKFRIMQRAPPAASDPADTCSTDGPGPESRSKWKTLEEREAAYAAAREKFLGKDGEAQAAAPKSEETSRAAAGLQDEIDPVPRRRYPNGGSGGVGFEPVFPSLYRPAKSPHHGHGRSPGPAQGMQEFAPQQQAGYFQNGMYPVYPVDMHGYPVMGAGAGGAGYPGAGGHQPQSAYMPPFMDGGQYAMMSPGGQQGGYQMPGWQAQQGGGGYPQQMMGQNGQYGMVQQQGGGQWAYAPMMNGSQPMPMIPQGMPYQAPAFYPVQQQGQVQGQPLPHLQQQRQHPQVQQQHQYPALAQPTPTRPQPQPHSSASSSISSRSYQEGSRSHSRGSTTSTRSAASGVRLGAIYSAAQGSGYSHRQKGMKQQGLNGLTSLGMGGGESKRGTRGHSPSSATTTSSQSSRRTGSIQLAPPTQHQLPQRPDWAANNVPYHPSPMLANPPDLAAQSTGATVASSAGPNVSEFPPLLRASTAAEPMQVERAKAKQLNGTVWNGAAVKSLHHSQPSLSGASAMSASQVLSSPPTSVLAAPGVPAELGDFERVTILPGPSRTPNPHTQSGVAAAVHSQAQAHTVGDADPDFPRRVPGKSAPTLYVPSASGSGSTRGVASALSPAPAVAPRPTSVAAAVAASQPAQPPAQAPSQPSTQPLPLSQPQSQAQAKPSSKSAGLSPEDIIEAKLAAVSINAGVSIGPPPARPAVASYAKIVRRD